MQPIEAFPFLHPAVVVVSIGFCLAGLGLLWRRKYNERKPKAFVSIVTGATVVAVALNACLLVGNPVARQLQAVDELVSVYGLTKAQALEVVRTDGGDGMLGLGSAPRVPFALYGSTNLVLDGAPVTVVTAWKGGEFKLLRLDASTDLIELERAK